MLFVLTLRFEVCFCFGLSTLYLSLSLSLSFSVIFLFHLHFSSLLDGWVNCVCTILIICHGSELYFFEGNELDALTGRQGVWEEEDGTDFFDAFGRVLCTTW